MLQAMSIAATLRNFSAILLGLLLTVPLLAQTRQSEPYHGNGGWQAPPPDFSKPAGFAHEWNRITIEIIKIDGFTPASAARNYAYANVAAYEAVVPGFPDCRSLAGQLNGFTLPPQPEAGKEYDWRAAMISAYKEVLPQLIYRRYISDSAAEEHYSILRNEGVPDDVMERSIAYGKSVADHVIAWMKKDHFVEIGAKPRYKVPVFDGAWERTPPAFWDPVDPYWDQLRPFILRSSDQFLPAAPPEFSTEPGSEFYKMAMDVYSTDTGATMEERLIAQFWDCNPIHSHFDGHLVYNTRQVSPGGHWISISAIAGEKAGLNLMQSLEMYVKVSTALSDAFMSAWNAKYKFNTIRPVTYVRRYIDSTWLPYIETPPFPEWTSAHSTISAAAAAVLTEELGEDFSFDDWTEAYLGLPVRTFDSFEDAAREVTYSRFWGGIHYLPSCLNGTTKGWELGEYVASSLHTRVQ
jgi:hypothetical protein